MARRHRLAPHDDLFRVFPSLPFVPPRSREEQIARIRALLADTRHRAQQSIARQIEATARLRVRVAEQKRRRR